MEFFVTTSKILRYGVFIALLVLGSNNLFAADYRLAIIHSNTAPVYQLLTEGMKRQLTPRKDDRFLLSEFLLAELDTEDKKYISSNNFDLIIAIGQAASDTILELKTDTPRISTLVPEQSFTRSLNSLAPDASQHSNIGAVFIDTPASHQLLLAKILLGDNIKLGMITSNLESENIKRVISEAKYFDIDLHVHEASNNDHLIRELVKALNGNNALLALPDPAIINRNTARNILLTTYRHKTPIITFSAAYVKAGAMAAVYSSTDQIAKQTAEMLVDALKSNQYTKEYAKYFSIAINENVAKALGIKIQGKDAIHQQLKQALEITPK
jgi:ABC-type uncharacterized transport system substrate-binding protein